MDYLNTIIFGVVQGVTEFLPVSSSGHLVLLHNFLNIPFGNEIVFDVSLHLASLLAVIYYFRKDIVKMIVSFVVSFSGKKDDYSKISWYIVFATIPAAVLGFFFEDVIDFYLRSPLVVVFMLVLVAIFFLIIERRAKPRVNMTDMSFKNAIVIGLSQALALIPGTSRSGITIITGLSLGIKREDAVKFSFLLSIPIIAGASIKKVPLLFEGDFLNAELYILFIAFIVTFFTAYFVIKFFLEFAKNYNFNIFAYYRIGLAIFMCVILYLF